MDGFVEASAAGSDADSMAWPQPTRSEASWPISAAGTSPKKDSAEYRPPMSDGLMKTSRKFSAWARRDSSVSSSVIATKWLAQGETPACSSL